MICLLAWKSILTWIINEATTNNVSSDLVYVFLVSLHVSFPVSLICSDGASLFTAFLKKEYAHENIEFWIDVENYRKARPSKFTSKAKKIFEDYIAVKSPKEVTLTQLDIKELNSLVIGCDEFFSSHKFFTQSEWLSSFLLIFFLSLLQQINVDTEVRHTIQASLSVADIKIFDHAQRKVQSLLEADAYQRFLQSDLYKDLLEPESPGHVSPSGVTPSGESPTQTSVKEATTSRSQQIVQQSRHSKGFLSFGRGSASVGAVSPSRSPTASVVTMSEDVIASLMNPMSRETTPVVEKDKKSSGKSSPESVLWVSQGVYHSRRPLIPFDADFYSSILLYPKHTLNYLSRKIYIHLSSIAQTHKNKK